MRIPEFLQKSLQKARTLNVELDALREEIIASNYGSMALHPKWKQYCQLEDKAFEANFAAQFMSDEWQKYTVEEQYAMLTSDRSQ